MRVGIGLPNAVPGATGGQLTEWARRAEDAGFSSLGTIDRVVYPNLEPLVTLGAAAAVTERIGLATTILIAPTRQSATLIAKQAASVHAISGGRLTLGTAPGGREDDFRASGADFAGRGDTFDRMLEQITSTWKESGARGGVGPDVASDPPELIIGGSIDRAFARAARHGEGWIMGGGTPEQFAEGREKTKAAWSEAGRAGEPRTAALSYFALGDNAEADANAYLTDYYAFLGDYAQAIADSAAKDADTVRAYVDAFSDAGCDELVLFPSSSDPAQVELLAEAAL